MSSTIYPNVVTGYTDPATEEFVEHGPPGVGETNGASTIYPNVVTGYTDPDTGEFIEHGPTDILDVSIGEVTSGPVAEVTNTGTGSEPIFNFVLPQGPAFTIDGEVETVDDLPAEGEYGDNLIVTETGQLYSWDVETESWVSQGTIVGPKGDAATIGIGTVITGPEATVVNVGTIHNAILDFTIPTSTINIDLDTSIENGTITPTTAIYTEFVDAPNIVTRNLPDPTVSNKGNIIIIRNNSIAEPITLFGKINKTTLGSLDIQASSSIQLQSNGTGWYKIN
jgi:hypothetical protein